MLTIFTPTYNRAYVLDKLYLSLCVQTNKDFEWLIIDDGQRIILRKNSKLDIGKKDSNQICLPEKCRKICST